MPYGKRRAVGKRRGRGIFKIAGNPAEFSKVGENGLPAEVWDVHDAQIRLSYIKSKARWTLVSVLSFRLLCLFIPCRRRHRTDLRCYSSCRCRHSAGRRRPRGTESYGMPRTDRRYHSCIPFAEYRSHKRESASAHRALTE